jgi:hypothetical protein
MPNRAANEASKGPQLPPQLTYRGHPVVTGEVGEVAAVPTGPWRCLPMITSALPDTAIIWLIVARPSVFVAIAAVRYVRRRSER